jgi:hypothetical protein
MKLSKTAERVSVLSDSEVLFLNWAVKVLQEIFRIGIK